jgi:hypothetical protein
MYTHLESNASRHWGPWLDHFSPGLRSTLPSPIPLDVPGRNFVQIPGCGGQPKQIPFPKRRADSSPADKRQRTHSTSPIPTTKIGPPRRKALRSGDEIHGVTALTPPHIDGEEDNDNDGGDEDDTIPLPYKITPNDWSDLVANKRKMKAWTVRQKEQRIERVSDSIPVLFFANFT